MDFHTLPRRDLQALCKRNGVRANMTNAAMAEALAALPTVDGIGEYVKEPVAVPAPEVKATAAAGEQLREKQGSPLPRGRRVTVKPVELDRGKEDEKRESAKDDAPALGVGRRGPSRRARPAPVRKEEEVEGKQDGSKEEDQGRDANKEDPPAPIVVRRGPSSRARPELSAESAAAGAVEEQRKKDGSAARRGRRAAVKSSEPIRTDDCEEEAQELKREAGTDGAPALGVGRRGGSRRARPAPAGKVTEEEKAPPVPRGRHVKAKSTEPEVDKKAATEPEEEEEDVPALGVGRRAASRCVRRSPAVAVVAGKVAGEDEPRAPIPHGHCVKVKTPEVIRLDDSEDEEKEDPKTDEKDDEAPAIGVGRRGASRRAPAPVEAPATRRRPATNKAEAVGVTEEAVPMRATRQRKPTMKAVAAAEKALPKATRRKAVKKTIPQQEEQEKPQEAVPAPVSDVGRDNPEDPEEEKQKHEEAMPAPVSDVGCDNPEDPEEQKQKHEIMVIIEDEILTEDTQAQELLVTNQESMDHSTLQGQEVGVQKCPIPLASQDDSPIMDLISMATEQAAHKDEGTNFQDGEGSSGSLDKRVFKEILDAGEEMEMVSIIQGLQASLTEEHIEEVVTDDANHESEIDSFNEVTHGTEETSEANAEVDLVSQNKEDINVDELQADLADGCVLIDSSGNIELFVEEEINEVNTEDGDSFQEKGDAPVGMALPDTVAETSEANTEDDLVSQNKEDTNIDELQVDLADGCIHIDSLGDMKFAEEEINEVNTEDDSSGNIKLFVEEEINTEDGDSFQEKGDAPVDVAVPDTEAETSEANTEDNLVSQNKEDINTDELQADLADGSVLVDCSGNFDCSGNIKIFVEEETNEVNCEDCVSFQKGGVPADMALPDTVAETIPSGCSNGISFVEMEKSRDITSESSESPTALDEDGEEANSYAGICLADKPSEVVIGDSASHVIVTDSKVVQEEKVVVITDEVPWSTARMHGDVEEDQFYGDQVAAADPLPEVKMVDCEVEEETTAMLFDEHQQNTVTMDEDVVDNHFETDVAHADEQKEVATIDEKVAVITEEVPQSTDKMDVGDDEIQSETVVLADQVLTADSVLGLNITDCEPIEGDKTPLVVDEKQQSTVTLDEDVADDQFKIDASYAIEKEKVVTADEVPEITGTNDEVVEEGEAVVNVEVVPRSTGTDEDIEEDQFQTFFVHAERVVTSDSVSDLKITDCAEKTTLLIDDKQRSTVTMNEAVDSDQSETDELLEVATEDKVAKLTGTEGAVVQKDKAAVITEKVPHGTGTMDDCVQKVYFQIGLVRNDEQNIAVTIDNVPEITEIDGAAKNTFVGDLPQELNIAKDSNDCITQALLDSVTDSLCNSTITVKPTASVSDGITVCNNSSEKNTTEMEAMQEEKGVKVAKKSMDLTKLSMRQLRTKLKEKLIAKKNKEAKRVALAKVDENMCRSNSKGQQQNLNLLQH